MLSQTDDSKQNMVHDNNKAFSNLSTSSASNSNNSMIEEEDDCALQQMNEEDLSFQLLREADTIHK